MINAEKSSSEKLSEGVLLTDIDMNVGNRFELKYRLNHFQYLKIRNEITPYVVKDPYTQRAEGGRYLVRSLYFDTYDYSAYEQKMNGFNERVKYRIRTYSKTMAEINSVRIEMKIRQCNRMIKHSSFVSIDEYQNFMTKKRWKNEQNPTAIEFERAVLARNIMPNVLIEYDREGYRTRTLDDIRITFDHRLRSAHAETLFPAHCFFQLHTSASIIMEVKFNHILPRWIEQLVRNHGLKVVANSKYTQGIQISRHDLYYPDQIIFVR